MSFDDDYLRVANSDDSEFMEFPKEEDGTLLLTTVQSHFPNAIGLKYRASSGAWRGLRAVDNKFDPPRGGWIDVVYYVTESEAQKRKADDGNGGLRKKAVSHLLQDIAILGLPWSTTDEELKDYFETNCGELTYCEVKKERDTGKSRGFGFIRFKNEHDAEEALKVEHFLGGRKLDMREKKVTPMKLFVGRVPNGATKEDLSEYFSQFGELKDVYIPTPFKNYGFVTFTSSEVGSYVLSQSHSLMGQRLNVDRGEESKQFNKRNNNATSAASNNYSNTGNTNNPANNFNSMTQMPQPQGNNYSSLPNFPTAAAPDQELKNMLFAFLAKQN